MVALRKVDCFSRVHFSLTYSANVRLKLRISQNTKMSRKKKILMDKMRELLIMNSKGQVEAKLGHVVQIRVFRLT